MISRSRQNLLNIVIKPPEFYNGLKTRRKNSKQEEYNCNHRSKQLSERQSTIISVWIVEKLNSYKEEHISMQTI